MTLAFGRHLGNCECGCLFGWTRASRHRLGILRLLMRKKDSAVAVALPPWWWTPVFLEFFQVSWSLFSFSLLFLYSIFMRAMMMTFLCCCSSFANDGCKRWTPKTWKGLWGCLVVFVTNFGENDFFPSRRHVCAFWRNFLLRSFSTRVYVDTWWRGRWMIFLVSHVPIRFESMTDDRKTLHELREFWTLLFTDHILSSIPRHCFTQLIASYHPQIPCYRSRA